MATKCSRVIVIENEVERLDTLDGLYRAKISQIATDKANLLSEMNNLRLVGCCIPIKKEKKNSLNGQVTGIEYAHADYCKNKADKLEV